MTNVTHGIFQWRIEIVSLAQEEARCVSCGRKVGLEILPNLIWVHKFILRIFETNSWSIGTSEESISRTDFLIIKWYFQIWLVWNRIVHWGNCHHLTNIWFITLEMVSTMSMSLRDSLLFLTQLFRGAFKREFNNSRIFYFVCIYIYIYIYLN